MYRDDVPTREIAKVAECSSPYISKIANKAGLVRGSEFFRSNSMVKYDHSKIIKMYKDNVLIHEIARIAGCSQQAIYRIVASRNVHRLAVRITNTRVIDHKEVVRLYAEGTPVRVIAKIVGCANATVSSIAKKKGLSRLSCNEKSLKIAILTMFESGSNHEEIIATTGASKRYVSDLGRMVGIKTRKTYSKEKQLAIQMRSEGARYSEIQEVTGLGKSTLTDLLCAENKKKRDSLLSSLKEKEHQIKTDRSQGKSVYQLAREHEISQHFMREFLGLNKSRVGDCHV